jgi:hypothetical protein
LPGRHFAITGIPPDLTFNGNDGHISKAPAKPEIRDLLAFSNGFGYIYRMQCSIMKDYRLRRSAVPVKLLHLGHMWLNFGQVVPK